MNSFSDRLRQFLIAVLLFGTNSSFAQEHPSLIGAGISVGFLKQIKQDPYYEKPKYLRNQTNYQSIFFVRPQKAFFGSYEIYYHSFEFSISNSRILNESTWGHGSMHENDVVFFKYSANAKRAGLISALNFRLAGKTKKLQLFAAIGLGIERTIQYQVIDDYYGTGRKFSYYYFDSNTGVWVDNRGQYSTSTSTSTESFNLNPNRNTIIISNTIRIQKQLTERFELAFQLGAQTYAGPIPGNLEGNFLVKTSSLSFQFYYRLGKKYKSTSPAPNQNTTPSR